MPGAGTPDHIHFNLKDGSLRACIQRVAEASVTVEGEIVGQIEKGLLVLLGVGKNDSPEEANWMAERIAGLRVFNDEQGKMNLSLADVGGAMLIVSQFTLWGDCRKGRRPSFVNAADPAVANTLYEMFVTLVREMGIEVATGKFREHMMVALVNDGPVTLWIDTADKP
jgi:D-tyrosyl-tRNA(Tyr) deacylase